MKIKKAHIRTMLPVAAFGFACFWSYFYFALFNPFQTIRATAETILFLKLIMLVGIVSSMLFVYAKRDLFDRTKHTSLSFVAMLFILFFGATEITASYFTLAPAILVAAWFLGGCAFTLIFLLWPTMFMISWQKDVGTYLSCSALAGAIIYLFTQQLNSPYIDIAFVLLPLVSLAILTYTQTHVMGTDQELKTSLEQTKLFVLTGFTLSVFGVLFGMALYWLCLNLDIINPLAIAAAIICGAGLHAITATFAKRYIPLSIAGKLSLMLLTISFLGLVVFYSNLAVFFYLFILGIYIYLDSSNISSLVGFASGHPSPFWFIARGQMVSFIGIAIGWILCLFMAHTSKDLLAYIPYLALCILLALALLIAFIPLKDNTFKDKTIEGEIMESGYFKQRCVQAAKNHKLSDRQQEILYYLAKGRNAQFIAEELSISVYTVKTHIYHIYQKMDINSQQELISIIDSTEILYQ